MVKNIDFWAYVIIDDNGEEIFRMFSKKELQSILIKKKSDYLYVKLKGYDNCLLLNRHCIK